MSKLSEWIAELVERAFSLRQDIYIPGEDQGRVMVYMEPDADGDCGAKRKGVRKNDKQ